MNYQLLQLVEAKPFSPAVPVRTVECFSIVTELTKARVELLNPSKIVAAGKHPTRLKEMEVRISIPCCAEQNALGGPFVLGYHRARGHYDWPVTAVLGNACNLQPPQPVMKCSVDISGMYYVCHFPSGEKSWGSKLYRLNFIPCVCFVLVKHCSWSAFH